eukprot:TRINITY_DN5046_c0_g1_i1.p1 TRINITY_DN5046_c0_g1~~TRINITY_DN5046_c0_g1_i1.p1  ORF type:complete len:329 (+),score=59.17 TRINITY_DN5046_c0_g1_i1:54-1040(+)
MTSSSSGLLDPSYGEYEVLDGESEDAWRKSTLFESPMIRFKAHNQILPQRFLGVAKKIHEFETRKDDVWIVSQIKSGSTWMGELSWCILHDLDFETALRDSLDMRMTYLEINAVSLECQQDFIPKDIIEVANTSSSPRLIKTHLSWSMLPKQILQKGNKMIYMLRNPRDVCISMYNHFRIFYNYTASMEEHVNHFLSGNCGYYTPHDVNILEHVRRRQDSPNILLVTYEEMKTDLSRVIDRVCKFLERPILEKPDKERLMDHLSIGKMRDNPSVNRGKASNIYVKNGQFINKGIVGNWKSTFSPDIIKQFEEWEKDKFNGLDFEWVFE